MKKTAILVDGDWFRRRLKRFFKDVALPSGVTAQIFYQNAVLCIEVASEEIFRIFVYDAHPFDRSQQNPISKENVPYGKQTSFYKSRNRFLEELSLMPFVALRMGTVKGKGWEITDGATKRLVDDASQQNSVVLNKNDIRYALEQKGVDMRIGMDVATLSLKKLVDRIIIISGDTDMVPAIKLARREGVQVGTVEIEGERIPHELKEDADFTRSIKPVFNVM